MAMRTAKKEKERKKIGTAREKKTFMHSYVSLFLVRAFFAATARLWRVLGSTYFHSKLKNWLIERGGTGKNEKKFGEAWLLFLSDNFVAAAAALYCWLRFLVVLYIQSLYFCSVSRNVWLRVNVVRVMLGPYSWQLMINKSMQRWGAMKYHAHFTYRGARDYISIHI